MRWRSIALANGMNVAAVFRSKETVARYMESGIDIGGTHVPVSRGDDTDLRFLDAPRPLHRTVCQR